MPIATARYDALPARIAPHRFPHVKRILLATVIVDDSPIHRVTKLFIHTNRQRVGDAHEQIDGLTLSSYPEYAIITYQFTLLLS